jgi:hypothetical protein
VLDVRNHALRVDIVESAVEAGLGFHDDADTPWPVCSCRPW